MNVLEKMDTLFPREPKSFSDKARDYTTRRVREIIAEARDKYRSPVDGRSNRNMAHKEAENILFSEAHKDATLYAGLFMLAPAAAVAKEEMSEVRDGVKELRARGRFIRENVDISSMSDAELEALCNRLVEDIRHLEVRLEEDPDDPDGDSSPIFDEEEAAEEGGDEDEEKGI
jgi:hypothetical protein